MIIKEVISLLNHTTTEDLKTQQDDLIMLKDLINYKLNEMLKGWDDTALNEMLKTRKKEVLK